MGLTTKEIMDLALKLAQLEEVPEDSGILVPGEDIEKVMVGVDIGDESDYCCPGGKGYLSDQGQWDC